MSPFLGKALVLVAAGAVVLVVAAALAAAYGKRTFQQRYEAERDALLERARARPPEPPAVDAALPAPVRRYLEVTGSTGTGGLKAAVMQQRGRLRAALDKPWMPFVAEQAYAFEPPGFVWLADARLAPLVSLLARDKFVDGRGNMLITVLGLVVVADASGPEIDLGAGLRFWGELISFPEAVLNRHLRWEEMDARHARVHIEQGPLKMSATIEFDARGFPVAMHAERFRDVAGQFVLTPWSGNFRDWGKIDGRLLPTRWEAVWHLPEGDFPAVEIEVLGVRTE